jgi:uncharacterized protein (TIGR03086 family)
MGPIEQLNAILPALNDLGDTIDVDQLGAPTPCTEFTVHDVLDHMIVLGGAFAHLFRGDTPPEASAPAVYGRVPAAELRDTMDDLLAAVQSDGAMERILDTPIGRMDGETFARVVAFDGLVHGWDLAVATGRPYPVDPAVVEEVHAFAREAITDDLRATGMFAPATEPPTDASPIEALAAHSGRTVEPRWRPAPKAIHLDKSTLPIKIDVPGAVARQVLSFGDATGYGQIAGEYFSLGAGTDIAPLLRGLHDDTCHAPHWGYMISGRLVVSFVDGTEETCRGGEIFYWAPGHSVRVLDDADVILFSPEAEHVAVLDHMLDVMATA